MEERPKVSVGVVITKNGKVLLGERLSSHGAGTWSLPGGHVEFGETLEDAALREIKEETGLVDLHVEKLIYVGNERMYGKHYINLGFEVSWISGEPYAAEPEKNQNWTWFAPEDLPENLFLASRWMIEAWLSGVVYKPS